MLTIQTGLNQHQHAKYRQRNPNQLFTLQTLTESKCAQNNGKKRLSLQYQRS